jgi:hypothetical protein
MKFSSGQFNTFICDVCNSAESGFGIELEDADMCVCERGHVFCDEHSNFDISDYSEYNTVDKQINFILEFGEEFGRAALDDEDVNEDDDDYEMVIKEIFEDFWYERAAEMRNSVPPEYCPICSFKFLPDSDIAKYLYYSNAKDKQAIVEEIKHKFGDYGSFKKAIK